MFIGFRNGKCGEHPNIYFLSARFDNSAGSFICNEDGLTYNRLLIARPNAEIAHYDKRHLFSFAGEDERFSAGDERLILGIRDFIVCPQICYDLRFPAWNRNGFEMEGWYDLLIFVANWPAIRSKAWSDLLVARAHENQAYVIGVNRVGKDGNGIEYSGDSVVIDPKGNVVASLPPGGEGWLVADLDLKELQRFREKFRPLDDADRIFREH